MRGDIRVGEVERLGRGRAGAAGCVVDEADDSVSGVFNRRMSFPVEGFEMDGIGDDCAGGGNCCPGGISTGWGRTESDKLS